MKKKEDIEVILSSHKKQIDLIEKMLLNMYDVSNIRFWFSHLSKFKKSENIYTDILQMEAFTQSIVISYGRIFGSGTGSTILNDKIIPEFLLPIHKEIIDLRHGKYAHHGQKSFLDKGVNIKFVDSYFIIEPTIDVGLYLGAPKKWNALFEWLDTYMYNKIQERLNFLSKTTGIEWKFATGPEPSYI